MCMVTFEWENCDAIKKVESFNRKKSTSWAILELTDQCNFNCIWCYANSGLKGHYMSKENVEKIIKTLADEGLVQITFSGGEPLLYPYLREAIKTAKNYGMVVHMNTNGYLLTKKLAKDLYDLGLTQVQINIDSTDFKKHDKIRGKIGSFNKSVEALKNAKAVGLTCVSQTVLTKQNENEIIDILKLARNIGVQRCRVWDVMPMGRGKGKKDLRPKDYIETLKKLIDFACETGAKRIESGDPLFPFDYKKNINVTGGYCATFAGLVIIISTKGDIFFCCAKRDKMYNIFDVMNKKVSVIDFHKFELEKYKSQLKIFPGCETCANFDRCKGGCPVRSEISKSSRDYWCQILKKHL